MNTLNKFRICHAIDIRHNGDQHPAFSIQRKNAFGIWVNLRKKFFEDPYSSDNPICVFNSVEEANNCIKKMVENFEKNTILKKSCDIISEHNTKCGTKLKIVKISNLFLDNSERDYYKIKIKYFFGLLWRNVHKNDIDKYSPAYILDFGSLESAEKSLNVLIKKIESENLSTTSSRTIEM